MKDHIIRDPLETFDYEFVVIGAGLSGMAAAIAAARRGVKTALIGDRPVLGGNASSEIGIEIDGACYNSRWSVSVYARETGLIEEIKNKLYHYAHAATDKGADHDAALFDMVLGEKNIDLYLNTYADGVECADDKIVSVECVQLAAERRLKFRAPLFADCTGDGTIGARAGALFMKGTEGREEFHEKLAPEHPTHITNGDTVMFRTVRTETPQPYERPKFAYDITKCSFFKGLGTNNRVFTKNWEGLFQGFWWVEYGGHLDTIKDNDEITWELRKIVYGLWDYIKNSGKFPEAENMKLIRVCPLAGKRESRRFVGDYILNQNDVENKTPFEDAAYIAGWPMDVHADYGVYDERPATYWNFVPGMYNVPFRTLYSKNIKNLLFAGRNTSCTRIANGSTRVMATCAAGGQAAGTGAYLCKKYGCAPREVYQNHVPELQALLLRDDQTIMGHREAYALSHAQCAASSVKPYENSDCEVLLPLEKSYVLALPTPSRIDRLSVFVKNEGQNAVLRYRILEGDLPENYLPERIVKQGELKLADGFAGKLILPVDAHAGKDNKVYIQFLPAKGVSLYASKESVTGVPTFICEEQEPFERDRRRFVFTRSYENICFADLAPAQNIFGAENVLSGYNRPYGLPNLWISDGKKAQYLSVSFDEKYAEEIHLVFNTELEEDVIFHQGTKVIRDYDFIIEGAWGEKTYNVRGNYDRVNRFAVGEKIEKITVRPLENYGAKHFEIFGVKIY